MYNLSKHKDYMRQVISEGNSGPTSLNGSVAGSSSQVFIDIFIDCIKISLYIKEHRKGRPVHSSPMYINKRGKAGHI